MNSSRNLVISIDSEGSDGGYMSICEGVLKFLNEDSETKVRLAVLENNAEECTSYFKDFSSRMEIVICKSAAQAELSPKNVLKDMQENYETEKFTYTMSSVIADTFLDKSDACIIPGHIGHALFMARFLQKIIRPIPNYTNALLSNIVSSNGCPRVMLDLGGAIDQNLYNLAIMGMEFAKSLFDIETPKVGFLNIGTEETKGLKSIIDSKNMFKENYSANLFRNGFIEPNEVCQDNDCNVVVSDGFVGNAVLKSGEGIFELLFSELKKTIGGIEDNTLKSELSSIVKKISTKYNIDLVAILLGFDAFILKCHGRSSSSQVCASLHRVKILIPAFKKFKNSFRNLEFKAAS
jgi:phosphate acyltransferase